jgi:hypothetical protein
MLTNGIIGPEASSVLSQITVEPLLILIPRPLPADVLEILYGTEMLTKMLLLELAGVIEALTPDSAVYVVNGDGVVAVVVDAYTT